MITPKQDNVVLKVKVVENDNKTASGIILQMQKTVEKQNTGEVIAVGPGRRTLNGDLIPIDLKVGDNVLFNAFAGTEVVINEETYLIIKENDIIASI